MNETAQPAKEDAAPTAKPASAAPEVSAEAAREIERLTQEIQRLNDQHLRTLADVENTRKRLQRDKDEFMKYASESLVRELLPIVDSLDQALVAVDQQSDPQAIIKGVHLIYRQLLGLLEKEGVKHLASIGEPFDPHQHEAVGQVDAADGVNDDTIVEEVQRGYLWHGKVLRPSLVKVAKRQQSAVSNQQSADNEEQTRDQQPSS